MTGWTPAQAFADLLWQASATPSSRHEPDVPEKDAWNALPRRTRRRIIGLGWADREGVAWDVAAQLLEHHTNRDWTPDDIVREMCRALGSVTAWRSEREHAARTRHARRHGYRSYWHYRKARRGASPARAA